MLPADPVAGGAGSVGEPGSTGDPGDVGEHGDLRDPGSPGSNAAVRSPAEPPHQERVLVLAPTGRDGALACEVLGHIGIPCHSLEDEDALCTEIEGGAGVAVIAEEALDSWSMNKLVVELGHQEPWSDLPLIVLASQNSGANLLESLGPLSNATILERPVRINTLVSAVQAALRARRRQYEVRDLLRRQAEADRRKDEFLAMLGHELRNPLAAIRNALWVLDTVGSQNEQPVHQRKIIERQSLHLVRMVDDLLDVSRVTLGKISLHRQTVDLDEVGRRCLAELGIAALAESHDLELSVRSEHVLVQGDPVRLEQVICNLLQNAVKYTPRGGRLTLSVRREDPWAVVQVADTGIGIPAESLPRVFEPFTQIESSRKRSQGGLGLGLPLVSRLVELHEGTVEAASPGAGRGSTFTVRLPLRQTAPPEDAAPPLPRPLGGAAQGGLEVLVIEDNADGRESLRELLEIWGHRVDLAETGPAGLAKALARSYDVALVDIGLPGLDGNEVARRIRAHSASTAGAADPALRGAEPIDLIAMTGYGQPEDRRRALEAGFDTYLVKPVDPGDLCRLLLELAASRRQPAGRGPLPKRGASPSSAALTP
jgi:signal transduction histidine kinase/FixJ family two-component response regulator